MPSLLRRQMIYKMNRLNNLPGTSKIWIYATANRLSESDASGIKSKMQDFLGEWNAHGAGLDAAFEIVNDHFLVLAANEEEVGASGCSIDKSINVFKEIDIQFRLNLFDRTRVFYKEGDQIKQIHFAKIEKALEEGSMKEDTIIFDTTISDLNSLKERFNAPLKNTWLSRYIPLKK